MLPRLVTSPVVENIYPSSGEDGADTARRASMRIILAGLPGAVYLPFGFSGGHVEFDGVAVRPFMASSPAEKARVQHTKLALKLRQKHDLGNASFAWAQGLPWQNRDAAVFLSGDIMCVVNTSDEALHVPLEHQLLLRSDSTKDDAIPASPTVLKTGPARIFTNTEREKQNCLSPGTTAWFKPARIQASGL